HLRELVVFEFRAKTLPEARLVKHLRAAPKIEIPCLIDTVSERDECCDNRARAGAGDIVKVVGEDELKITAALAQLQVYPREDFDADNSANAATVARKQFPRTNLIQFVAVTHVHRK